MQNQNYKPRKHSGFTLIELIAVLTIISVLVAIAIPIYVYTHENAQNTACQANLRTIDGAIQQWRATDPSHMGIPGLETDIMGTYIVDPLICPETKTFTYTVNSSTGVAECNEHTYP